MKAISVHDPMATALFEGWSPILNRPYLDVIDPDEWIAIHCTRILHQQLIDWMIANKFTYDPGDWIPGVIMGAVKFGKPVSSSSSQWFSGPFALPVLQINKFESPIPAHGDLYLAPKYILPDEGRPNIFNLGPKEAVKAQKMLDDSPAIPREYYYKNPFGRSVHEPKHNPYAKNDEEPEGSS